MDTFPPGIEGIGTCVFYGRQSLESIVLPQGLKTIGPFAFMDCTNLKRLVISPTNEEVLGYFSVIAERLRRWVPKSGGAEPRIKEVGN